LLPLFFLPDSHFGVIPLFSSTPCLPPPPTNLYEYQRKGLTKLAFRNSLILKGAILVILGLQTLKWLQGKEKREQAPALQT
jgi:hypothetical protein